MTDDQKDEQILIDNGVIILPPQLDHGHKRAQKVGNPSEDPL
jgi:hypothetical protein